MVKVVGVVGSPRKDGLTARLVTKVMEGAASEGAQAEIVHLAEVKINPCDDCRGKKCWGAGPCKYDGQDDARALQEKIEGANAFVLGAPVYFWDVNARTKNFMDRMRFKDVNGLHAIGISVAGGTGRGMCEALRTIYNFFGCVGMRGLTPMPVCRFNFDASMREAVKHGAALAKSAAGRAPFASFAERLTWLHSLPHINQDVYDNMFFLAKLVADAVPRREETKEALQKVRAQLVKAAQMIENDKKEDSADEVMRAYTAAVEAWKLGQPKPPAPTT
jgi:multimeric flavodoxin WrbA